MVGWLGLFGAGEGSRGQDSCSSRQTSSVASPEKTSSFSLLEETLIRLAWTLRPSMRVDPITRSVSPLLSHHGWDFGGFDWQPHQEPQEKVKGTSPKEEMLSGEDG